MIADLAIVETRKEIEHFCGLGARVMISRRVTQTSENGTENEQLEQVRGPEIR
jgi:IS5 family transposase